MCKVVVFYKADCLESFVATWFLQMKYPGSICLDIKQGECIPLFDTTARVITVGLSPSAIEIGALAVEANRLIMLGVSQECERELFEHYLVNVLPDSLTLKFTGSNNLALDVWNLMFNDLKVPAIATHLKDIVLQDIFKNSDKCFTKWAETQANYVSYFDNAYADNNNVVTLHQPAETSKWHISNLKSA